MNPIIRKYKVSDPYMLSFNKTKLGYFTDDQAAFSGFDADFTTPFETNWAGVIEAAELIPTDETLKDQLQQLTALVEEAAEKCRTKFQHSKYFIEKAFPDSPAVRNEFGFDDYDKARRTQLGTLQFMRTFFATATKYAVELDAVGYNAAAVAEIDVLRADLDKANNDQEKFKGTRTLKTEERIIAMNKAWDVMVQVCKAGKIIFAADPAKYQLYLLPASSETGQDISIAGLVTDVSDNPLEDVTVRVDELAVEITTDSNGNYVFGNLPEGTYTLTFSLAGYTSQTIPNVEVQAGETTTVNVQLVSVSS